MDAEEILATFPEFVTPPAGQSVYLSLADSLTADSSTWNDNDDVRALAVALQAAHMMVRVGLGTTSPVGPGVVSTQRIGELSVTYLNSIDNGDTDLMTTVYGRQLAELRAAHVIAATVNTNG